MVDVTAAPALSAAAPALSAAAPALSAAAPMCTTSQAAPAHEQVAQSGSSGAPNSATGVATLSGFRIAHIPGAPERMVVEIAAQQRGRISRSQLMQAGLTRARIQSAVRRGWLTRVTHNVYRVGAEAQQPLTRETDALLSAGADARLMGLSVLVATGLLRADPREPVHITSASDRRITSREPFLFHALRDLRPRDFTVRERLPMTTVERALLDAAPHLSPRELERAVDEALAPHRRLSSRTKMRELLARTRPNQPGHAPLTRLANPSRTNSRTESELAEAALLLIRAAGLPEPRTEEDLFGFRADKFWPEAGVVLEADHHTYHGVSRRGFNRDRRKDRIYAQHGLHVVRWSDEDINSRPLECVGQLGMTLGTRIAGRRGHS